MRRWKRAVGAVVFGCVLISDGLQVIDPPDPEVLMHIPAAFGPPISQDDPGVSGRLVRVGLGCEDLLEGEEEFNFSNQETNLTGQIAYVTRGRCQFVDKVLRAQRLGAIGVIVHNTREAPNTIFQMGYHSKEVADMVMIPSVFILYDEHLYMTQYLSPSSKFEVHAPPGQFENITVMINATGQKLPDEVDLTNAFVASIMFLVKLLLITMSILGAIYLTQYCKSQLAKRKRMQVIRKLPTRVYRAVENENDSPAHLSLEGHATLPGRQRVPVTENESQIEIELQPIQPSSDNQQQQEQARESPVTDYYSSENCVICLCDFEDGETLTVLPCGHGYHKECIEPWLTQKSALCPICKTSILPSGDARPLSEINAAEDRNEDADGCDSLKRSLLILLPALIILLLGSDSDNR